VLLGNLFQQLYNIADTSIVGRFLGPASLAAIGSTGSLTFMVIGFAMGLCLGFCIPVARAFGAKDIAALRLYLSNIIALTIAISVVLSIGSALLTNRILQTMQTPDDMFDDARAYISILFSGIFVTMAYNILANLSRSIGDSRTPLIFLIAATFVNIALDLLFILAFGWGVSGAAIATVISQAASGIACFIYMTRRFPELRISRKEFRLDARVMGELLYMGVPMALQFSITAVGSIIMQACVNQYGSSIAAAVTAGSKVQMILTTPLDSIGMSMATYVSQNLGARRLDRIRTGVNQTLLASLVLSVLGFFGALKLGPPLALLFLDASQTEILAHIQQYLMYSASCLYVLASLMILRNALQGLGYSVPAMAAGLFELIARAVVGLVFVRSIGFSAICISNPAAWFAADIFLIPAYAMAMRRMKRRAAVEGWVTTSSQRV
jgi:putative MATE family efflux protein